MNVTFNRLAETSKPIAFNPKWKNGTGYLDEAIVGEHAPSLMIGEAVTCKDDFGRAVVIIGLNDNKNFVMFQRHSGNIPDGVIVCNEPAGFGDQLEKAYPNAEIYSRLREKDVKAVCDYVAHNIAVNTSTNWGEYSSHLSPWSVV